MPSTNASEGQNAVKVPNAIAAQRMLWTSIVFCGLILTEPGVFEWSLYTSPVLAGVTILHHLIILILSAKQRRNVGQESLPSAVSRASVVFSTGLLILFWLGSFSVLLSILMWSMFKNDLEVNGKVLKPVEKKLSLAATVWYIVMELVYLVLFGIMTFSLWFLARLRKTGLQAKEALVPGENKLFKEATKPEAEAADLLVEIDACEENNKSPV